MDFTEDNDTDDEISTIFPPKLNVLYLSQISLLRDIDLWKKKNWISDGMNSEGLTVGALYLPDFTNYQVRI